MPCHAHDIIRHWLKFPFNGFRIASLVVVLVCFFPVSSGWEGVWEQRLKWQWYGEAEVSHGAARELVTLATHTVLDIDRVSNLKNIPKEFLPKKEEFHSFYFHRIPRPFLFASSSSSSVRLCYLWKQRCNQIILHALAKINGKILTRKRFNSLSWHRTTHFLHSHLPVLSPFFSLCLSAMRTNLITTEDIRNRLSSSSIYRSPTLNTFFFHQQRFLILWPFFAEWENYVHIL